MKKTLVFVALLISIFATSSSASAQSVPGTSPYPGSLDDVVSLFQTANNARSTLAAPLTIGASSLTLVDASKFTNSGEVSINNEIIYFTSKSGNVLSGLLRGQDGTTAASALKGATVEMRITSRHHQVLADAIRAIQSKIGIGTRIDASKIGGGNVSSTEFDFLNGVDGPVATHGYVDAAVAAVSGGGSGANTALSNLASVAINTSLLSDADNTDDLGSPAKRWKDFYLAGKIRAKGSASSYSFDSTTASADQYAGIGVSTGVLTLHASNAGGSGSVSVLNVQGNIGNGAISSGSVRLFADAPSATTPNIAPRGVFDSDTGIGTPGDDKLSLIGGGAEFVRLVERRLSLMNAATANPTTSELPSLAAASFYVKGSKFVIAYNNAGTITYITIPLDGSTTALTHSTTAP